MRTHSPVQYSLDTAHTIEVTREEDANGEFGSFGFTLLYEKPPIVGTIVPGTHCSPRELLQACACVKLYCMGLKGVKGASYASHN